VALSPPAADRRFNTWPWLVVAFSAKQKQHHHQQQLTNDSTILKTFMFPVKLDLFNLESSAEIRLPADFKYSCTSPLFYLL